MQLIQIHQSRNRTFMPLYPNGVHSAWPRNYYCLKSRQMPLPYSIIFYKKDVIYSRLGMTVSNMAIYISVLTTIQSAPKHMISNISYGHRTFQLSSLSTTWANQYQEANLSNPHLIKTHQAYYCGQLWRPHHIKDILYTMLENVQQRATEFITAW